MFERLRSLVRFRSSRHFLAIGGHFISGYGEMALATLKTVIEKATQDLAQYYPKAVVLFGSAARYLQSMQTQEPEDIDLLYVGSIQQIKQTAYCIPTDLFFYRVYEILSIARSLRYLPHSLARAKMYLKDTYKGYVRADIVACLLLGSAYAEYGFLQMENEKEYRDYSVHMVLYGGPWWRALQQYAQEHRGIKGLVIDKTLRLDQFTEVE